MPNGYHPPEERDEPLVLNTKDGEFVEIPLGGRDITIAEVMDANRQLYRALQLEADTREDGIAKWYDFMTRYSRDILGEEWGKDALHDKPQHKGRYDSIEGVYPPRPMRYRVRITSGDSTYFDFEIEQSDGDVPIIPIVIELLSENALPYAMNPDEL